MGGWSEHQERNDRVGPVRRGEARPGEGREEIEMEGGEGKRGREKEVGELQGPFSEEGGGAEAQRR